MNKILINLVLAVSFMLLLHACSPADGNNTGHEFMPDMGHSIAYEANYYNYYSFNTWGEEEDYKTYAMPRKPVKGTIPRGYAGSASNAMKVHKGLNSHSGIAVPVNGSVPYYYEDTEEERIRATNEIIDNPFPITEEGLEKAKILYETFCGICHGEKGDGGGYLVRDDGGVYPAQPANFLTDEFVSASNGRYYHSIMYGKNVMGGYKDKLSYEERWQVIHYIRSLQAKDRKLEYNASINTLNSVDVPEAKWVYEVEEEVEATGDHSTDDNHHDGHQHGDDHGHEDDSNYEEIEH
jgi:hypothetical protein